MEKFDSMEGQIIYNKLIEYSDVKNNDNIPVASYSNNHIAEICRLIPELERTRENNANRPITSHRRFVGRFVIFFKKVVRKLTRFYIDPIAVQQTEFNNTVTPIIGQMTEAIVKLEGEVETSKKEAQERKELLKKKAQEREELLKKETQEREELLKKEAQERERMLSEQLKLCSEKIVLLDEDMNKLKQLDLDIFSERTDNFWMKYSQAGEDCICEFILMMLGYRWEDCSYLDLGANHAKELSNTYFFYKRGVRGVLVEANPDLIPELKFYRNGDVVINKCVTVSGEDAVDFYIMSGDGLSTFDLDSANAAIEANPELKITKTINVESITVNKIIEDYMGKTPTILNIDIEGKDIDILKSIDFEKYRPLIVITEMIEYKPELVVGMKNQNILEYMSGIDYIEYAFTGINSIFLDKSVIKEN